MQTILDDYFEDLKKIRSTKKKELRNLNNYRRYFRGKNIKKKNFIDDTILFPCSKILKENTFLEFHTYVYEYDQNKNILI